MKAWTNGWGSDGRARDDRREERTDTQRNKLRRKKGTDGWMERRLDRRKERWSKEKRGKNGEAHRAAKKTIGGRRDVKRNGRQRNEGEKKGQSEEWTDGWPRGPIERFIKCRYRPVFWGAYGTFIVVFCVTFKASTTKKAFILLKGEK